MQKEKGRGGGRTHEKEIKRGRINSEEENRREQELGGGINEFHLEGIGVKWQLLSGADWQRKICPRTHGRPQVDVSVCACAGTF